MALMTPHLGCQAYVTPIGSLQASVEGEYLVGAPPSSETAMSVSPGPKARPIVSDRRGCGLSERYEPGHLPPMESTTDDALAVLDAAGSERAVLFLTGWWGLVATFLAAAHPERVSGIVYLEFSPALTATDETPWEPSAEDWERSITETKETWGTRRWLTVHDPGTTDPRETGVVLALDGRVLRSRRIPRGEELARYRRAQPPVVDPGSDTRVGE